MCIVSGVNKDKSTDLSKLGFNLNDISSKGWPKVAKALANRVEIDSLGNILTIDGKQIHAFPWVSWYILEDSEHFKKYKNGLTHDPECKKEDYSQSVWQQLKDEAVYYWKEWKPYTKENITF